MSLSSVKLTKQQREFLGSLQELSAEYAAEVVSVDKTASGHVSYTLRRKGVEKKIFCSGSPSDIYWFKQGLRYARKDLITMAR
jgi:hypothetical protein